MARVLPYHITSFELADLMCVSEHTALRRMQEMRKKLGLPKRCLLRRKDVLEYFGL